MSIQVSTGIIAICMLIITFASVVLAVILAILGIRATKAIKTLTNRANPLITQATETAKTVNDMAKVVKDRAEGIMSTAEGTVEGVAQKVKTTSNMVQESIRPPIITVASLLTGISRGLEVFSQARKRGGNGHAQREY